MNHPKCIYCGITDSDLFNSREHVIPQSFGKFGAETPTLHCVCKKCNAFFGKVFDQELARDTIEGITRYTKGIRSRERRLSKSLQFTLREDDENGFFGGAILGGIDPDTGHLLPPISQFWIRNKETSQWEKYSKDEISNLSIANKKYGVPGEKELKIIAASKQEHDAVVNELSAHGITYKQKNEIIAPPSLKTIDDKGNATITVGIQGIIDKNKKRALVKILFNFATYSLGEQEVLKSEWDKARQFVRFDGNILKGQISQKPFWTGQETDEMRFADDSYNLRIENLKGDVVGTIQLYNIFTYEFILVEHYSLFQEVSVRFTPGKKPIFGFKGTKPKRIERGLKLKNWQKSLPSQK